MKSASATALSDDDLATLDELLEVHSPLDLDELLGLLHAVVIAPSVLQPSVWMPLILPAATGGLEREAVTTLVGLVLCQYNEVVDRIAHSSALLPMAEDSGGCKAFAAGYVAGAELDPEWRGNADRWTFALPLAYLAGRLDLIPEAMIDDIERDLQPDPKKLIREQMSSLVATTADCFAKYRRTSTAPQPHHHRVRLGRNDPCFCGSGKKYKRCCAGRTEGPPDATGR